MGCKIKKISTTFRDKLAHLSIALFSILAVYVQISTSLEDDAMNMYKAVGGLICLVIAFFFSGRIILVPGLRVGVLMSIFMIVSIIYNGNARFVNIIWIWAYLGVSLLLIKYRSSRFFSELVLYVGCAYFLFLSIFVGVSSNEAMGHGSANNISILCIYLLAIYLFSIRGGDKAIPYIPTLLIMFVSIWAGNRSGIISTGLFFILSLYANQKNETTKKNKILNSVSALIIVGFAVYFGGKYISVFDEALMYKMDRQGMESARSLLWAEYLNGCFKSLGNLFFGVPANTPEYPTLSYYAGNPHNTFLMLHAKFGLMGFVVVIVNLLQSFVKIVKRKDYVLIGIFSVVSIRAFFDWAAFPGIYDVIFFYFILYNMLPPKMTSQNV